jgi:hypothetical protein
MLALSDHRDSRELDSQNLNDRLHDADAITRELMSEVVDMKCRRFPSLKQTEKTARLERLIGSGAWTDAALALIDLELPQWQIRRLAYDEGEWHCALSRQRELPEWLDQAVEVHHADLPMAILSAFVDAQRVSAPMVGTSVPAVVQNAGSFYESVNCDNFA